MPQTFQGLLMNQSYVSLGRYFHKPDLLAHDCFRLNRKIVALEKAVYRQREDERPHANLLDDGDEELLEYQSRLQVPFRSLDQVNAVFADDARRKDLQSYISTYVTTDDFVKSFFNLVLHPTLAQSCFFRTHG
jgi:hypothetical protein